MNKILPKSTTLYFPKVRPGNIVIIYAGHKPNRQIFGYYLVCSKTDYVNNPRDYFLMSLTKGVPWDMRKLWAALKPNQVEVLPAGSEFTLLTGESSQ